VPILVSKSVEATREGKLIVAEQANGQAEDDRRRIAKKFRISYVFDISQTEGKPQADLAPIVASPGESLDALLDIYRKREEEKVSGLESRNESAYLFLSAR
jgi:hypothetical protein